MKKQLTRALAALTPLIALAAFIAFVPDEAKAADAYGRASYAEIEYDSAGTARTITVTTAGTPVVVANANWTAGDVPNRSRDRTLFTTTPASGTIECEANMAVLVSFSVSGTPGATGDTPIFTVHTTESGGSATATKISARATADGTAVLKDNYAAQGIVECEANEVIDLRFDSNGNSDTFDINTLQFNAVEIARY